MFKYRSRKDLQSELIIPRSPSPELEDIVPLSARSRNIGNLPIDKEAKLANLKVRTKVSQESDVGLGIEAYGHIYKRPTFHLSFGDCRHVFSSERGPGHSHISLPLFLGARLTISSEKSSKSKQKTEKTTHEDENEVVTTKSQVAAELTRLLAALMAPSSSI